MCGLKPVQQLQHGKAGNRYPAWLWDVWLPTDSLFAMCLNNCIDVAAENNWSAFVESTVEIKTPW